MKREVFFVEHLVHGKINPVRIGEGEAFETGVLRRFSSEKLGKFGLGFRVIERSGRLVAMAVATSGDQTALADLLSLDEGLIGVVYPDVKARLIGNPRLVISNGVDLREETRKPKRDRIHPQLVIATASFSDPGFRWGQRI